MLKFQKEREEYEVIVENGKLIYRQSGKVVDTDEKTKWIFVLSTTRALYIGQKKKGSFQHSSFLAGGATTAAGRLVAHQGVLEVQNLLYHAFNYYIALFHRQICLLNIVYNINILGYMAI